MQPTKEQIESYGKQIYSILSDSGELTPFDELVCGAFTYFWILEKSGQCKFLVANPVAKIDAIYHGTINEGNWATTDEILEYLLQYWHTGFPCMPILFFWRFHYGTESDPRFRSP